MMKRWLISLFLLIPVLGYARDTVVTPAVNKYAQVLFYINNLYLDTTNVSGLTDKAIEAVLKELDPHSTFISKEEVKAANEPLDGEFEGIGVEFAIINDTLTVQAPVAGGPSEKVGIRGGDKIIEVDGEKITDISLDIPKVHKFLRGRKGTKVDLTVKRDQVAGPLTFTVTRDKIPLYSVDASYIHQGKYLYIKLSRFAYASGQEIRDALNRYGPSSRGLILDLRGNAGGYLHSAIQIANEFLDYGNLIVSTEGRSIKPDYQFADGKGIYRTKPMVVLIDENSASASEIVSGAVQDWDRGIIIGRRSFGKGLVQRAMPLIDGSQLRLTIARYHTPSGRVIQAPYEKGEADKYYQRFIERYTSGEIYSKDSIHFPDSLKYRTRKKNRIVYGGGGIMPDVFVPQDTTGYTRYFSGLIMRGIVLDYMNNLYDDHREQWKRKYPNYHVFERDFAIDERMFTGLLEYAGTRGLPRNDKEIAVSKPQILSYMKSLAASSILGRDAFYKVHNEEDNPMFRKALEVLDNWGKFTF